LRIAPTLRALVTGAIDYAGLYPPASLPLEIVCERYRGFLASPDAWILNRLILPAAALSQTTLDANWRISLLVEKEPGPLPPQVETLEVKATARLSLPTYCEAPLEQVKGAFAKIRTGGLTPEAIPSADEVAAFLAGAAARRLPFKATAGLHHPVRSMRALTYAPASPRAVMHGFLNVFAAAAFAWGGAPHEMLREVIEETEPGAFGFGEGSFEWRGRKLTLEQITNARAQFAHSFGSCSFEEPVADLRSLGLLP
jgi:hypothetical protein